MRAGEGLTGGLRRGPADGVYQNLLYVWVVEGRIRFMPGLEEENPSIASGPGCSRSETPLPRGTIR